MSGVYVTGIVFFFTIFFAVDYISVGLKRWRESDQRRSDLIWGLMLLSLGLVGLAFLALTKSWMISWFTALAGAGLARLATMMIPEQQILLNVAHVLHQVASVKKQIDGDEGKIEVYVYGGKYILEARAEDGRVFLRNERVFIEKFDARSGVYIVGRVSGVIT